MDDKTVEEYLAKVHAARARYMLAPIQSVEEAAAAEEHNDAYAMFMLVLAAQGESNG